MLCGADSNPCPVRQAVSSAVQWRERARGSIIWAALRWRGRGGNLAICAIRPICPRFRLSRPQRSQRLDRLQHFAKFTTDRPTRWMSKCRTKAARLSHNRNRRLHHSSSSSSRHQARKAPRQTLRQATRLEIRASGGICQEKPLSSQRHRDKLLLTYDPQDNERREHAR